MRSKPLNDFVGGYYGFHIGAVRNVKNTRRLILRDRNFKCLRVMDVNERVTPLTNNSVRYLRLYLLKTFSFSS